MHRALRWTGIAAALTAALGSTATLAAEGGVPEALRDINATLNALIATVNRLSPAAAPTALVTSPLQAGGNLNQGNPNALLNDRFICNVHNAGTTVAHVTITVVDSSGTAVRVVPNETLNPGHTFLTAVQDGIFVCRFTVSTGSLSQLRANATVRARQTGSTIATAEAR